MKQLDKTSIFPCVKGLLQAGLSFGFPVNRHPNILKLDIPKSDIQGIIPGMNENDEDIQELVLKVRLDTAQALMHNGKLDEAERIYKQALKQAETIAGEDSPLAALVLIDIYDLYEKQGRHDDAKPLWSRIRQIAILHLEKHK